MGKMLGLAFLILGVVLLVMGVSASESIGSDFSRFFTGKPTDKSIWLMIGGIVSLGLGAGGMFVPWGNPRRA